MLLEFSVANYRSVNKKCTLSMLSQRGIKDKPDSNVITCNSFNILKTATIYGANSSGKSNFIHALMEMKQILLGSVKLNSSDALHYDPFVLSTSSGKPSFFEAVFMIGDHKYRYGFELTASKITDEWLFRSKRLGKECPLFIRNSDGIGVSERKFNEGIGKEKNTNENRLFLSLCAQLGGDTSKSIINWFEYQCNIISGLERNDFWSFTATMLHENQNGSLHARKFFKNGKFDFEELRTIEMEHLNGNKILSFQSKHHVFDEHGNVAAEVYFDLDKESSGTNKLIQFSGPIFDTLFYGKTLVIDELDTQMHPLMSMYIIDLFHNPMSNPQNAQLIFSTHDINLLSFKLFRRDQIWFTEKDCTKQTDLYNMMDIILPDGSKPRNDANYEKNYIAGRYGAIPYIVNE